MIKQRLYKKLVEKNEDICREYKHYVHTHPEEHKKHRLRSWWLLLRLNMHYRFFRRKNNLLRQSPPKGTPPATKPAATKPAVAKPAAAKPAAAKPAVRLPYLDGAESLSVYRTAPHVLAQKFLKYDIISFDVFDTLLFRPFDEPKVLFSLLGEKFGIYDFYSIRVASEQEARNFNQLTRGNSEVTLAEIYALIEQKIGLNAQYGMEKELELECKYCFANPYMKTLYKILSEMGKTLIATSDMYLSSTQISYLLHLNGYDNIDSVYVSCEYNTSKRSGGLYAILKRFYPKQTIVHIGDNSASDYEAARKNGIDAEHYRSITYLGSLHRAEGFSSLTGSLYNGIINTTLLNGFDQYDAKYEYGFIYGGLYVLGYASWINRTAKQSNVEKVLFLSRDGDIYSKIYDMLPNHLPWEYFHWSRIVGMKLGTTYDFNEFVQRMVFHKAISVNRPKIGNLLNSLGLGFLVDKLKQYRLNPNEILGNENKKVLGQVFWDERPNIIAAYEDERKLTYAIIKKAVGNCKKIAIVDVGWAGSGPLGIKHIIENELKLDCEVECYLAANHHHMPILAAPSLMDERIHVYMFSQLHNRINYDSHRNTNNGVNNVLFEIFTQACSPTFAGYTKYGMAFDTPEVENYAIIKAIHKGIMDFATKYLQFFGDEPYLMNISGYDAYLPFRMIKKNLKLIKNEFGDLCMSRVVLSDTENQQIESLAALLNQVNA